MMNNELKTLLTIYENKLASLWQLEGQLIECEDDNRYFYLESKQKRLQIEADNARQALVDKVSELSAVG